MKSPQQSNRAILFLLGLAALCIWTFVDDGIDWAKDLVADKPSGLKWVDCSENGVRLECASLMVPLDHDDPKSAKISIALNRKRASNGTSKGFLLLNPGGPGGSGKTLVSRGGGLISEILEGKLDLIGFDPRGIGESQAITCAKDSAKAGALASQFQFSNAFLGISSLDIRVGALAQTFSRECLFHSGKLLKHVSTYYVVKDMELIRQALGMKKMRYWGFSYGSYLGNSYANMYPEMAERIVIDGVVDPREFSGTSIDFMRGFYSFYREALEEFGAACDRAHEHCPLSGKAFERIVQIAEKLVEAPLQLMEEVNVPTVLTSEMFLSSLLGMLYIPNTWPQFAKAIAEVETGNAAGLLRLVAPQLFETEEQCGQSPIGSMLESNQAIACADESPETQMSLEEWASGEKNITVFVSDKLPRFGGAVGFLPCRTWPRDPSWKRYAGPWNNKFDTPVLVVGTRYDPVTPFRSAVNTHALMNQGHSEENAVLLINNGHGHCSLGQRSDCSNKAIREFLLEGILPKSGTVCESSQPVFPKSTQLQEKAIDIRRMLEHYYFPIPVPWKM
ncbi:hypothetical protein HDV03_000210 [Kappamyces sp. JEL0829]|nr:hypothetical protein HDV03_000210 [Kappamyces sp. JEL0829]